MMRLLTLAVVSLLCLYQPSEGAPSLEKLQKNWKNILSHLPEPWHLIFEKTSFQSKAEDEVTLCEVCQEVVPPIKLVAALFPDFEAVRDPVYDLCIFIIEQLSEGANAAVLCKSVDTQGPPVFSIFKDSDATTEKICRNLNMCFDPPEGSEKPQAVKKAAHHKLAKSKGRKSSKVKKPRAEVVRFVQVADIHVDPKFAVGSPDDCGLVVCCRNHYNGTGSAGTYGSYTCNTPQRTLELFLEKVKELNPDFVVHTGDNPTHHMWEENREESIECSDIAYGSLQRILEGTPVYCAIGNHESYPTNLYNPRTDETQDLLRRFVDWWSPLADLGEEQQTTILRSAVYSVPSQIEGLRILSINSNFWYIYNFYNIILEDSEEEKYVKDFVEESLASARAAGEKVLMLLHHPQGHSDNIVKHARWFRQVVADYSDIILFGLSGHTHYDELKLFRDPATGSPTSAVYVAPSITPMASSGGGVNPSMRMFTLDAETFEVLEIEQYQLDLSKIDVENPEIQLIYRFTEEYQLPDASLQSLEQFVQRLQDSPEYFEKWWQNRNTRGPKDEECVDGCRIEKICQIDNVVYDEYLECVGQARIQKHKIHPVAARYSHKLRKELTNKD